ncbi:MAG: acyl-CoA dehydrogenase family protein [Myxococcota bacterium]
MNFALSEEQEMLQETVRQWVENECPPASVRERFDAPTESSEDLWKGMVELGLSGLLVPEALGGAGLELLDLAVVAEELGRGAVPGSFYAHSLATLALVLGGSEEQKSRWLPALASGEARGALALGEAGEVWGPEDWTLEHGGGALRGEKAFGWGVDGADLLVVGTAGGGLVLVEGAAPGLSTSPVDGLDRTRRLQRVVFDGTPAVALPGYVAGRLRDAALVLLAADAFGAGFALVRMSAEYAQNREQFGQPIAQFQAVKHQLADMALDVDPTRGLWWFAAHAFDRQPEEAPRAAALAKAHITERVMEVARSAVEVHGGLGFTWECDVQIWFKRALFDRTCFGTPEVHRERIAALGGW